MTLRSRYDELVEAEKSHELDVRIANSHPRRTSEDERSAELATKDFTGLDITCASKNFDDLRQLVKSSQNPTFKGIRTLTLIINSSRWDEAQDDLLAISLCPFKDQEHACGTTDKASRTNTHNLNYLRIFIEGDILFTRRTYALISSAGSRFAPPELQRLHKGQRTFSQVASNLPQFKGNEGYKYYTIQSVEKQFIQALLQVRNVKMAIIDGAMEPILAIDLKEAMTAPFGSTTTAAGRLLGEFTEPDNEPQEISSDSLFADIPELNFASMRQICAADSDDLDRQGKGHLYVPTIEDIVADPSLAMVKKKKKDTEEDTSGVWRPGATDKCNRVVLGWDAPRWMKRFNVAQIGSKSECRDPSGFLDSDSEMEDLSSVEY